MPISTTLPKGQPFIEDIPFFEVIIVGGSYSGLAAAMSLGRALRQVLIIDDGKPCNRFAPHSHNFLTQDGVAPQEILETAKKQLVAYSTVEILSDRVITADQQVPDFVVQSLSGKFFRSRKLLFTTGLRDILPEIPGFMDCWGASIIHCPFCHGYEFKGEKTGILADGEDALHYAELLSQWTSQLSIFTNGGSSLSPAQMTILKKRGIKIYDAPVDSIRSNNRQIQSLQLKKSDATIHTVPVSVLYHGPKNEQSCPVPAALGCLLNKAGLLQLDNMQQTTVPGIYAAGDNSAMRSVASAVGSGTFAGAAINIVLTQEKFAREQ